MTPQLGGQISEAFFSRYDATVQTALNSGPNVYVILDIVRIISCSHRRGYLCIHRSTITRAGMALSSTKAVRRTTSSLACGPRLQQDIRAMTVLLFVSSTTALLLYRTSSTHSQFGIMNEPHDLNSISPWVDSVQAAVNAIRAAGATSQIILIPGSSWSSAQALPTEAGPLLLGVTDPAGGNSKLLFDGVSPLLACLIITYIRETSPQVP